MTTVSIKDPPFNAAGDTQTVLATVSIGTAPSSGPTNLVSTTPLWVLGDVGKTIGLGTSPGAAYIQAFNTTPFITTIAAFNSSTDITLTDPTPFTLASASRYVTWGTDDSAAFGLFNTTFVGQSGVILDIPAGNYLLAKGFALATGLGPGIPGLLIQGAGTGSTTLTGDPAFGGMSTGCKALADLAINNSGSARLTSAANAGLTTIFVSPADTNKFVAGQIALLTGIDLQTPSYPMNPAFIDYITIVGINAGTGRIDFTPPLVNSYKTTWPLYEPGGPTGFDPDYGGPGTLYTWLLNSGSGLASAIWACAVEYKDFAIAAGGQQVNNSGKSVTFTNIDWISGTPVPSDDVTWLATNNIIREPIEIDKNIGTVTFQDCDLQSVNVQSRSAARIIHNNCIFTNEVNSVAISGTGLSGRISDVVANGTLLTGVTGFGTSDNLTVTNSTFAGFSPRAATQVYDRANITFVGNHTILIPASQGIPVWAVPGGFFIMSKVFPYDTIGQVVDMTADGSLNLTITVDMLGHNFPPCITSSTGNFTITAHPCPSANITTSGIANWDPSIAYIKDDSQVKGSDGQYYWCLANSSTGDNPISSPTIWRKITSLGISPATELDSYNAALAQAKPFGSYVKRQYDATMLYNTEVDGQNAGWKSFVIGKLVCVTITVTQPYTGVGTLTVDPFSAFGFLIALDPTFTSQVSGYQVLVDLRTTGTRVITPTTVTGSVGADSLGSPPGDIWFAGAFSPSVSRDVTGDLQAKWPIYTIEYVTDQGVTGPQPPPPPPLGGAILLSEDGEILLADDGSTILITEGGSAIGTWVFLG